MADAINRKILPGRPEEYLEQAERTVRFLTAHAFLESGDCAFVLSEAGEPREPAPGRGFATSIFADCFVAMGLAEYHVWRAGRGNWRWRGGSSSGWSGESRPGAFQRPRPGAPGRQAHGVAMIMLNVALVLSRGRTELGDRRAAEASACAVAGVEKILGPLLRLPHDPDASARRWVAG